MAVGEVFKESNGTYTFRSICSFCKQPSEVKGLRKRALDRWDMGKGVYVQDAFPDLTPDDREILLTGTHGACFDKLFPPDDECPKCSDQADEDSLCVCLWWCQHLNCTGEPDPF